MSEKLSKRKYHAIPFLDRSGLVRMILSDASRTGSSTPMSEDERLMLQQQERIATLERRLDGAESAYVELSAAKAILEAALAEMTRQRDEALKEPTIDECGLELTWNACARFIAARRKRITGDGK